MSVVPHAASKKRLPGVLDNPVELSGVRGLAYWSFAHVIYIVLLSMLPPNSGLIYQLYKFLGLSVVTCTMVTFVKLKVPLRLVAPVILVMALQIWFAFCDMHASLTLGRFSKFGTPNFLLVLYVFYFIQASTLSYYAPHYRKLFIKLLLWSFTLSAFVAVLQFAKLGPAIALGNLYNTSHELDNWDQKGGVRAFGLTGWPESMAMVCVGAFALVAGRMQTRKLAWWEICYCGFFIVVGFMCQARTMYISIIGCFFLFIWMLAKRDRKVAMVFVVAASVLFTALSIVAYERFSYAFASRGLAEDSFRFRTEVGWPQAYKIFALRPWTGIGPDLGLVFTGQISMPDKFVTGATLDSGYLMLIAWGGLPALVIFLTAMFLGIRGAYRTSKIADADLDRRILGFFTMALLLALLNDMLTATGFVTQPGVNLVLMTAAGLCMPSRNELPRVQRLPLTL